MFVATVPVSVTISVVAISVSVTISIAAISVAVVSATIAVVTSSISIAVSISISIILSENGMDLHGDQQEEDSDGKAEGVGFHVYESLNVLILEQLMEQ